MQESAKGPNNKWYTDSGCTRHMTGERSLLTDFKQGNNGFVSFAGNKGGDITRSGKVTNGKITLEQVYYVEKLDYNLISISQICDKNHSVHFTNKEALVLKPGFEIPEDWIMMRAPRKSNLHQMDMSTAESSNGSTCLLSKASESESLLWHRRMANLHL